MIIDPVQDDQQQALDLGSEEEPQPEGNLTM
jgi:hypothetical protein